MEIKHVKTILAAGILLVYIVILLKLIVFKYSPGMVFDVTSDYYGNYLPFKTILSYLSGEPTWTIAIRNLAGNILPFIPLGLIAPFLYRPLTWKHILTAGFALSFGIEALQILLHAGTFDVDDLLLNTLGVIIGYVFFVGFKRTYLHFQSRSRLSK